MLLVSSASKSACSGLFGWMLPLRVGESPSEALRLAIVVQDCCATSFNGNQLAIVERKKVVRHGGYFLFEAEG